MVLWKLTYRAMYHRPLRALLTLASIVIGVAAVVAVMLSSQTTRLAQQALYETVTGRAQLEVTPDDGETFLQDLVEELENAPGIKAAVPMFQRNALLTVVDPTADSAKAEIKPSNDPIKKDSATLTDPQPGLREAKLQVLGVDPARHELVHDHELAEGQPLGEERGVLLDAGLARHLGIKVNDQVTYSTPRGDRTGKVVGLFKPRGVTATSHNSVLFMTLAKAQRDFGIKNRIHRVLLVLEEGTSEEEAMASIKPLLPEGVNVHRPTARSQIADANAMSIEQGLDMAFVFALLVAVFVILNTFMMNVGERAKQLAIMRAVGATRRQIVWLLLRKALLMGIVGGVLGAMAGLYGAQFLKEGMERLFRTTLPQVQLTWQPFLIAAGVGVAVSLIGALVPAIKAGRLTPLEGIKGVSRSMENVSWWASLAGLPLILLAAAGLIASYLQKTPAMVGIVTANIGLIGVVLMFPPFIRPLSQFAVRLMRPVLRTESTLAQRQILRHRARTMLTMGVLFVAISTAIALASCVLDNVRNVRDWYRQTIVADFFIWKMMPGMGDGLSGEIPDTLGPEIRSVPGVMGVDTLCWRNFPNLEGYQAIIVSRDFPSDDFVNFDTRGKEAVNLRQRLLAGEVIVGSPLAQKLGKGPGDELIFTTQSGPKKARIAAVNNEYRAGGLLVNMHRATAKNLLGIEGIDEYIIKADPQRRAEVEDALAAICMRHGISVHSLAEIVNMIDGMVDGLVVGLWGVMVLGFVVTALGVVNTLTMNVLEQTRELGLLRVVGMTRWQVRRMIVSQGLLLGSLALIPGLLSGLFVAWVINIATLPATGHAVQMGFYPALIGGVLVLALLTAAVAAFLPAERAARMPPSSCLQYE